MTTKRTTVIATRVSCETADEAYRYADEHHTVADMLRDGLKYIMNQRKNERLKNERLKE